MDSFCESASVVFDAPAYAPWSIPTFAGKRLSVFYRSVDDTEEMGADI